MTGRIPEREWQELSAYLDDQLSAKENIRLEEKLQASSELRGALDDIRRLRAVLRSQPRLRAPRNFTLSPEALGIKPSRREASRRLPLFGFVSAFASVLLVLVLAGEFLLAGPQAPPVPPFIESQPEAAIVAEALEEMPAESEALPLAQEVGDASSKVLEIQVSPEAELRAYPAPDSIESGVMAAEAQESTPMPYPSPAATAAEGQEDEAVSMAAEEPAAEEPVAGGKDLIQEQPTTSPSFWNGWRVAQIALLVVALASALIALSRRRAIGK